LGEATANAVEHAYPDEPGEFEYEVARVAGGGIRISVRDEGRWRPEPADNSHRGRGVALIRALAGHFDLDRGADGTSLTFELAAAPPGAEPALPPADAAVSADPADVGLTVDDSGDSVVTVRLTGDLDLTSVDALRGTLLARIGTEDHRGLDIDLTGLAYVSSSGIALLLQAAAAAARAGRTMAVVTRENSAPARILALSGLYGVSAHDALTVREVP
jgi:anti-anti-sigma factor